MKRKLGVFVRVWAWRLTHWQQWCQAQDDHRDLSNAYD